MKVALRIIRIIVGVLFIFSGLIKANDPTGLAYKMQEFFEVWGMDFLNSYTLAFALVMNTFEIVAGVAILIGWRIRLISWLLLLLIIFFTFLTAYAMFSGKIKTCGCFGDCIPLKPMQSFIKDLVLLVLILVIFAKRNAIRPFFSSFLNGFIILLSTAFCIVLQWYVLNHLPIFDCLPYKKGNNITEQMKIPEGAVADSFVIMFRYKKNGKDVVFDANSFPDDFDESIYKNPKREQKLVRPGTAIAPITDFNLTGVSGEDTTESILSQPGYYVLLLSKNTNEAHTGWSRNAVSVSEEAHKKHIPFFMVTATVDDAQRQLNGHDNIYFLSSDATAIKTAARVNPTYFIMKGAVVQGKYADADYNAVIAEIGKLK